MSPAADLQRVQGLLAQATRVAVLSGAGMSAESGVPTFRDAQTGLWARFNPEQLATEEGFRADPQLVWDWYQSRRDAIARVAPNAGHEALARFCARHPGRLTLITQNVDGLHQRAAREAGVDLTAQPVLALHGNIAEDRWLDAPARCCDESSVAPGRPPRCPVCGNLRRPAVVWFGEMLPARELAAAEEAAAQCDVMLVVGTAGAVYPAAGLARTARAAGATVIIVNPNASELDDAAQIVLRGTSAVLLPQLLD